MDDPPPATGTRCVYAYPHPTAMAALDKLPSNPARSSAVHKLVAALDLLHHPGSCRPAPDKLNRARPLLTRLASPTELQVFHDPEYVELLMSGCKADSDSDTESDAQDSQDVCGSAHGSSQPGSPSDRRPRKRTRIASDLNLSRFGLEHDCPMFPELAPYSLAVAAAALDVSRELREDRADVGIVWDGGRHHAQPSCAAGFCYVNDIALAVAQLRKTPQKASLKRLDRVLYIDLDLHHGDGVESAFWTTSRVLTVSVHYHDPQSGFYPVTGATESCGPPPPSPGASHAVNIPLKPPDSLMYVCERLLLPIMSAYQPSAVLLQCGVDGLAGDPIGGQLWGYGLEEMGACVAALLHKATSECRKVMLFGGGGYHTANTARAWAYFTSIAFAAWKKTRPGHGDSVGIGKGP